jgi:hypothetical protein
MSSISGGTLVPIPAMRTSSQTVLNSRNIGLA